MKGQASPQTQADRELRPNASTQNTVTLLGGQIRNLRLRGCKLESHLSLQLYLVRRGQTPEREGSADLTGESFRNVVLPPNWPPEGKSMW